MSAAGGDDDVVAQEMFERNQQAFTELYAAHDPKRTVAEVRRGIDHVRDNSALWVGDLCFWHGDLVDRLPGARVLEIGCGRGETAMMMLQLGAAHVTALEINDSTERLVNETAALLDFTDRVDVRIGDVMDMDLPLHSFDLVVCKSVLHHVVTSQEEAFVARTAELVTHDGMTRVSDPAVNSRTLDAIRWAIPTSWRPSSLQKEKFAAWQAQDEHPVRDNSTDHVSDILGHHYGRVESMTAGVVVRVHRLIPDRDFKPKVLREMVKFDQSLPESVRRPLAAFHGLSAYEPLG